MVWMMLGVGGGSADAELFELLHQACFGEARRGLGEVLRGEHLDRADGLLFLQVGQELVFAGDAGDFHEAVEDELATAGAEDGLGALGVGDDRRGGLVELGRGASGRRRSGAR
jgi:hypothetical protein